MALLHILHLKLPEHNLYSCIPSFLRLTICW